MSQTLWQIGEGTAAIGPLLAAERERQGVSQGALARRLGIAQSNLSRIEHGADLRLSTLLDIARALRLEPMLVPKHAVRTVRAVLNDAGARGGDPAGADARDRAEGSESVPPRRGRFTL
jgi:HTH-type transcriptional regulator/antitoxin HipB